VLGFQARTPESAAQFHLRVSHFFPPAHRRRIRWGSEELTAGHHRDGGKEAGEA